MIVSGVGALGSTPEKTWSLTDVLVINPKEARAVVNRGSAVLPIRLPWAALVN